MPEISRSLANGSALASLLSAVLGGAAAHAAPPLGASLTALGDTRVANPHDVSGTSPASLALQPRYDLVGGVRWGYKDDLLYQVGAGDSRSGPLTLALSYTRRTASPPPDIEDLPGWALPDDDLDNPVTQTEVTGGLAGAWFQRRFAFGLTGVYRAQTSRFSGTERTGDAGLSLAGQPVAGLIFAASASNLVDLARETPSDDPLSIALGASWAIAEPIRVLVEADVAPQLPQAPWDLRAGLEVTPTPGVPLRLGFEQSGLLDTQYLSAGLGLDSGTVAIEYAIRRDIGKNGGAIDETGIKTWHVATLRIPIPDTDF